MKVLVVADYPRPGHPYAGIFNERCVKALKEFCDRVDVLAHRPYVPSLLSCVPRWRSWTVSNGLEVVDGVSIHRPAYLQVPRLGSAFCVDKGAFFWCRPTVRELHRCVGFDAILSFDLFGTGGVAWRLGHDLGIPATGWATGSDVRQRIGSRLERVVARAIKRLDLVFYQSLELFEIAARLLGTSAEMMPKEKHVVLSRGIPEPPALPETETRNRVRSALGVGDDQIMVLTVAAIVRNKGVFELLEAISSAAARNPRICCVVLGSRPALDETNSVKRVLDRTPILKDRVKLLPACNPDKVWEYLYAADIFAFPSHNEGMPNSLLEAMAVGLPAVAFAIPPIREIKAGTGGLVTVPTFDTVLFAEAIVRLAASPKERARIGEKGKAQVMERFMVRRNMGEVFRRLRELLENRGSRYRKAAVP